MEAIKGAQPVTQSDLRPGDHIFTPGLERNFNHGIYVGNGMIIHFIPVTRPDVQDDTEQDIIGVYGKVVKSCINSFGNQIYLYRYGVSWREALLNPGTCCPYKSKHLHEAVETANLLLNTGFGGYDPISNNSEHFATFCRTGIKYSLQPIFEKFGDKVPELPVEELGKIAAGTNVSVAVM
ncbi:LRAT domain-containing protein [Cephalotus follicularis]|uniref:LRAT domain-containing protein n=1 Tax=Cephalotus follicularis TaxID=3775 RepID=A0A1Q3BFU4_CEPFO|nr:LRAT domain-containing protein [Cephalotus follicularis]